VKNYQLGEFLDNDYKKELEKLYFILCGKAKSTD